MNALKNIIIINLSAIASVFVLALIIGTTYSPKGMITVSMAKPALVTEDYNMLWAAEFTEEDVDCLAQNIYFEARGEGDEGKYAVAEVVLNRRMHHDYPDTVCDVIYQARTFTYNDREILVKHKCQFSWYCDGKSDRIQNVDAYKAAEDIAEEVLFSDAYQKKVPYALYYHNLEVNPHWANNTNLVRTIGYHSFYR